MISGNTAQSLPLNSRNTDQLALLLPSRVTYNQRSFTNISTMNMNHPFMNGDREQTNNFTVDGLDIEPDRSTTASRFNPLRPDAVRRNERQNQQPGSTFSATSAARS